MGQDFVLFLVGKGFELDDTLGLVFFVFLWVFRKELELEFGLGLQSLCLGVLNKSSFIKIKKPE